MLEQARGKFNVPSDFAAAARDIRFTVLGSSQVHAVRQLPQLHADLLDRLFIAQAQVEGLTLVTRDAEIGRYGGARPRCVPQRAGVRCSPTATG
mgnify:CR=1 FL=1